MSNLWFFWGQQHMTFLRWMTLFSATQIHGNVVLVLRKDPVKPVVQWREKQDFQMKPLGLNWMEMLKMNYLPIKKVFLEDIAPEIAQLQASDVQTSDLLAWWLLANHGGTVADMDIVFLKPLPKITQNVELVVFNGHPKPNYIPVTIMQGKPCQSWHETYDNAFKNYNPDDYESCGSKALIIQPQAGLDEHIVFPWAGKYPWGKWHDWMFGVKEWPEIPETCCGIHWYAGHNQKWNQLITQEDDLKRGAVAWAIRKALRWEIFFESIGR